MSIKNDFNQWNSVPTQIPTALAPSQTTTAILNPQQVAVASSTLDYYSNQEHSNPSQIVTNSFINTWFQSFQQRNPTPTQIPTALAPSQIPTALAPSQIPPALAPRQIPTALAPSQTLTAVKLKERIEIRPAHKEKIQKLSKQVLKELYSIIGQPFYRIAKDKVQTISTRNAIIMDIISGDNIFFSKEFDQKFSIQDLIPPAKEKQRTKGKKRQLPASSQIPAKKQRTAADDQSTNINVNDPYFHQIPYYVNQAPPHEIPASITPPASTTPQEPSISPETTVVPEEFTFESNATAETNHSGSSSGSSSPSNSSEVFNGFELEEFTNEEIVIIRDSQNTNIDWSDWNFNFNQ